MSNFEICHIFERNKFKSKLRNLSEYFLKKKQFLVFKFAYMHFELSLNKLG